MDVCAAFLVHNFSPAVQNFSEKGFARPFCPKAMLKVSNNFIFFEKLLHPFSHQLFYEGISD